MSALFKKYLWVVNLAFVAALAWLAASAVGAVAGASLFLVPEPPKSSTEGEDAAILATGRVAGELQAATTLSERKVFDLADHTEEPAEVVEEGEEKPPEIDPNAELTESELPIELLGTLVHNDAETSMATLAIDGKNELAWVGTSLLDGQAEVVAIAPRHIIVKEATVLKVVKLWSDKAATPAPDRAGIPGSPRDPGGAQPARPRPVPQADAGEDKPDYAAGVKKTGPYDYELDKGMLDQQLQDLSALGTQARVVPNYRNGKYEGFKLVGVRPGSLYRSIGIRSGDVIKSINGRPIDSPNKALELFDQLKSSSALNVEIERRGQPKQLNYSIK
jgi:general secretion pathway protein C